MAASTITRTTWTDDDGTGTTGTIINNAALHADVYDKVDQLMAGTGSYTTLTLGGSLSVEGGQITFPATQNASSGANVLDDYEEGSWTPVIGGSGGTSGQSYTTQVGRYIKIGKCVVASFKATLSAKGTITTTVQIQGLPFTVDNVSNLNHVATLLYNALATNWVNVIAVPAVATTVATVFGTAAAATNNATGLVTGDISNTTTLSGTIIYQASA